MSSSKRCTAPSLAVVALLLSGCGGTSDFDAIKKKVDDHRQWQSATVSNCDEMRHGSDLGRGWPSEATFYACDLRNLDERGYRSLGPGLPARPSRVVHVCFAVLHDEYGDVVLVGPAHDNGPCSKSRSA